MGTRKLGGTTTINRGKNIIRRLTSTDFVESPDGVNTLEAQNNEWHDGSGSALLDVAYIESKIVPASDASSPKSALVLSCTPSRALPGVESLAADEPVSATDIQGTQGPPLVTSIGRPQPLPLRDQMWVDLAVGAGRSEAVRASVYDVRGRRVRSLADELVAPGRYRLEWDGRTSSGTRVAAGVYFVRVEIGRLARTAKVVVVN